MITWSYGVTTCTQRLRTTLPATLMSLDKAGFASPRVFCDGPLDRSIGNFPTTVRDRPVGPFGNWLLAAWELYIRRPQARMYAIFQDDILICRGTREYLERCNRPEKSYLNLFTFASNEHRIFGKPQGWVKSDQLGHGGVALVFDHEAMFTLFQQRHLLNKPQLPNGHKNLDGAVQHAMVVEAKYTEYVHNPSLVQHIGDKSTASNPRHPPAATFPGADFDARKLLEMESPA